MAATNVKPLNPSAKDRLFNYVGTGALAATDDLVIKPKKYPVGTTYFDLTNKILYIRVAATLPAGAIGDWFKTVAFTAAT